MSTTDNAVLNKAYYTIATIIKQNGTISDIDTELGKYPEEVQHAIINYTDPASKFRNTLLNYTIMEEKPAITNYLLDRGADITAVNAEGDTALIMGLTYLNDVDLIKRLLKDTEHNNRANTSGETALMLAIENPSFKREQTLEFIDLLANPEVIDKQNMGGTTALMYAAKKSTTHETRTTLINKLLEYNPNVNLKNDDGDTVLRLVAQSKSNFPEPFNTLASRANQATRNNAAHLINHESYRRYGIRNNANFTALDIELKIFLKDLLTIPEVYEDIRTIDKASLVAILDPPETASPHPFSMCTDISEFYAEHSLRTADVIIAFYKMVGTNKIVLGFLLADYKDTDNTLHISLVCTNSRYKGIGKRLIQIIKEIASQNTIGNITLESVNNAKTFYSRLGFEGNMVNSSSDYMVYSMSKYKGKGGNRNTKRRTTKPKKRRSTTRRRR